MNCFSNEKAEEKADARPFHGFKDRRLLFSPAERTRMYHCLQIRVIIALAVLFAPATPYLNFLPLLRFNCSRKLNHPNPGLIRAYFLFRVTHLNRRRM